MLEVLGVIDNKVFKKAPNTCSDCKGGKFDTLEIIGVHDKPLFYECVECGTLYLKYKRNWVAEKFKVLSGLYTNPDDWIEPTSPKEYN